MKILWRSAGGMGNQIFQLLFVRLISKFYGDVKIFHTHKANYERICSWEYPISIPFARPCFFEILLISLRIPKILYRLGLIKREWIKLFGYLIIDGYFLEKNDYLKFDFLDIKQELNRLRKELKLNPTKNQDSIFHLRLGDFFNNFEEEINFVLSFIRGAQEFVSVISNNDQLFIINKEIQDLVKQRNILYLVTGNYSSLELLQLFCDYKTIYSNGSTLSCMASILSDSEMNNLPSIKLNKYQYQNFNKLANTANFLKSIK